MNVFHGYTLKANGFENAFNVKAWAHQPLVIGERVNLMEGELIEHYHAGYATVETDLKMAIMWINVDEYNALLNDIPFCVLHKKFYVEYSKHETFSFMSLSIKYRE